MPKGQFHISVRFLGEVALLRENYCIFSLNHTNWLENILQIGKMWKMEKKELDAVELEQQIVISAMPHHSILPIVI